MGSHLIGRHPTLEEAFYCAMLEAINIYVGQALGRRGYLTPDVEADVRGELLRAKHEIVAEIAARWASRFRADLAGQPAILND